MRKRLGAKLLGDLQDVYAPVGAGDQRVTRRRSLIPCERGFAATASAEHTAECEGNAKRTSGAGMSVHLAAEMHHLFRGFCTFFFWRGDRYGSRSLGLGFGSSRPWGGL